MKGTYIGNERMLISPIWGGKLVVPSNDLSLAPDLILSGVLETPLTKYFAQNVKKGSIVVDIGANIGYFSVLLGYLVGSEGRVYSFEANRFIFDYLLDNLSINYLHDRIEALNCAVYSNDETISFYVSKKFMGNSSIHAHSEEYKRNYFEETEEVQVSAVVLDQFFETQEKIDFLKIDIEGGEYQAFIGMGHLLKNKIITTVVFELNKGMLQDDWAPFIDLLKEYEYLGRKYYVLSDEGELVNVELNELKNLEGYPYVIMQNA